jgi:flagellar assembly protein FliH
MSVEQESSDDTLRPRVSAFKPKAFEECSFETVSAVKTQVVFDPLTLDVVQASSNATDPMFEDFTLSVTVGSEFVADFEEEEIADERHDVSTLEDDSLGAYSQDAELGADGEAEPQIVADSTDEAEARMSDEDSQAIESEPTAGDGHSMTAEAWAEQERILREEFEQQVAAAHAEGVEKGRTEAFAETEEKLKGVEQRYATLVEDMGAQIQERVSDVERKAVQFAVEVARKLVGSIVEINPEYILTIIKEAIALTGGASIKSIRVSPQDLEFLKLLSPEKQFKEFDGTWSFVADETIRQGCVVETSAGSAEYDLEKAWERIKEQVAKVR